MILKPNTIDGLTWGIQNFDGVELDIRLSHDNALIIHHDPALPTGQLISKLNAKEIQSFGVPLLSELFTSETVGTLLKKGKTLWLEIKPNCMQKKRIDQDIATTIYDAFIDELKNSGLAKSIMKFISFSEKLLYPFAEDREFSVYPILPDINECNQKLLVMRALPQVLRHSLKWHISTALKRNYTGILFAREYLVGLFSFRHPSYKKLINLMNKTGIELGTNLGSMDSEKDFPQLHRFTDDTGIFPRFAKKGEGQIIAHRGTGTKGVKISSS